MMPRSYKMVLKATRIRLRIDHSHRLRLSHFVLHDLLGFSMSKGQYSFKDSPLIQPLRFSHALRVGERSGHF